MKIPFISCLCLTGEPIVVSVDNVCLCAAGEMWLWQQMRQSPLQSKSFFVYCCWCQLSDEQQLLRWWQRICVIIITVGSHSSVNFGVDTLSLIYISWKQKNQLVFSPFRTITVDLWQFVFFAWNLNFYCKTKKKRKKRNFEFRHVSNEARRRKTRFVDDTFACENIGTV